MEKLFDLILFTRADRPGSLLLRAGIWLLGVLVVAAAVDKGKDEIGLRMDVGWFFLFLCSAGAISFLVFGFVPTF